MADEPLTLKVMRLRQPQVDVPQVVLSADGVGFDAPKLLLPMSLTQSLVGEDFSGYLHLSNNSAAIVNNVILRVELQIGNSKISLFSNASNPVASIAHGEFFDAHVAHSLKDAGTYVLTCNITYSLASLPSSEPQGFKRAYRFPAVQPFSVLHRVVQLDSRLLIECTIENATKENIVLVRAMLKCSKEGLHCSVQGLQEGDGSSSSSTSTLLRPRGVQHVVFIVTPSDASAASAMAALSDLDLVGTLSLTWRVPDGPSGCTDSHQVRIRPGVPRDLDLRVVACPQQVSVEVPFELEVEVANRTSRVMEPCITFDMQMMGSVKVHGAVQHRVGRLEPFSRVQLPLSLLAVVPGLHTLRGVFVLDALSQASVK